MSKEPEPQAVFDETREIISNADLYKEMRSAFDFNVVTGLPCGELRYFIADASRDKETLHLPTANEREAVGIATGAWLAGEKPVLYMQNSGLFLASNDIGSLLLACKLPIPIVASWRGVPGETATQHFATGAGTEPLLEAFDIPHVSEANPEQLKLLRQQMDQLQSPVCVLKIRERFNESPSAQVLEPAQRQIGELLREEDGLQPLSREEAIFSLLPQIDQSVAVVSSTGLISRSIYEHFDAPNQFYNAGAFGLTSSIGFGLAMARPELKTVVVEGDGSVLANLGNLNLIGSNRPSNLIHVVLNNRSYVSCSGEPTCQPELIPQLAQQFGYESVYDINSQDGVIGAYQEAMRSNKTTMIHVNINTLGRRNFDRPTAMADIARRFQVHFSHE